MHLPSHIAIFPHCKPLFYRFKLFINCVWCTHVRRCPSGHVCAFWKIFPDSLCALYFNHYYYYVDWLDLAQPFWGVCGICLWRVRFLCNSLNLRYENNQVHMLHAFRLPTKSAKGSPIPFLVWQSLTLQLYHKAWHPISGEMLSRLKTGSSQFGVHRTWMESACATKTLTWRWFTAQWHESHMLAVTHLFQQGNLKIWAFCLHFWHNDIVYMPLR